MQSINRHRKQREQAVVSKAGEGYHKEREEELRTPFFASLAREEKLHPSLTSAQHERAINRRGTRLPETRKPDFGRFHGRRLRFERNVPPQGVRRRFCIWGEIQSFARRRDKAIALNDDSGARRNSPPSRSREGAETVVEFIMRQ
ncbi:hypothetical protein EYF80_040410 [Liparis tanakae]|uniref:Uncharacterized protein n=1 Tax=Liparis tanakae TaxID=230148 RepID=A0A4Z2G785_9TELE|nr:hypothetical protein EYF80_040410 [Liparis tanakae]